MKFGYLSNTPHNTGALRTEESVRQAIKDLQRFGGLPETGHLDEKTQKLMRTPRCGLPDYVDKRRKKRFTKQGQVWNHTNLTWRSVFKLNLLLLSIYSIWFISINSLLN